MSSDETSSRRDRREAAGDQGGAQSGCQGAASQQGKQTRGSRAAHYASSAKRYCSVLIMRLAASVLIFTQSHPPSPLIYQKIWHRRPAP